MTHATISLFILVCALQVLDGYTTYRCVSLGGRELNPIVRMMIEDLGLTPSLVLLKVVVIFVSATLVVASWITLALIAAYYSVVVVSNVRSIRRMQWRHSGR